jgi:hypothetical protein
MKALLFTIVLLVVGDFTINHGDATHYTVAAVTSFFHWLSNVGTDSIFSQ